MKKLSRPKFNAVRPSVVPPDVGIARHDQRACDRRRQQDGPRHDGGRRGDQGEEGHRAPGNEPLEKVVRFNR